MSSNITLPTTSVQITSQNIPLLASQSHESIFPTPVSATVELIHSVSVYLFHKVTNSRCQRLIRKANSCKIAKSQHSCAELLWETSQLKEESLLLTESMPRQWKDVFCSPHWPTDRGFCPPATLRTSNALFKICYFLIIICSWNLRCEEQSTEKSSRKQCLSSRVI